MKNVVVVLGMALALSACTQNIWTKSGGADEYVWIGCHTVTENPSKDGSIAFGLLGLKTETFYFKQKSSDGTEENVTTGVPCG